MVHPTRRSIHKEAGQSGGTRKRKRQTSLGNVQQSPFGSPQSRNYINSTIDASAAARTTPTSHEHYNRALKSSRSDATSSFESGHTSDSPPGTYRSQRVQRKDQVTSSGSRRHLSGYETDQPLSSTRTRLPGGAMSSQEQHQGSDRRVTTQLQPPPAPVEGSQRMHDKVVSFLQDNFMEGGNGFTRDRAHVGSLSNAALLRVYWFAQGRLDTWVGSRLPKHLNYKKVEIVSVIHFFRRGTLCRHF